MGISLITALSIFRNPYDLIFFIGQRDGKYNIHICFSPKMRCRPLVHSNPVYETSEQAIEDMNQILNASIEEGEKERKGGLLPGRKGPFLDQALRERILADLRSDRHEADTYEYEQPADDNPTGR